jgi:transcriptional regulator GlxA family with amidase domain
MRTRRIGILCCEDLAQLDAVGPIEVISEANDSRRAEGKPPAYEVSLLVWGQRPMATRLWPQQPYRDAPPLDTLLIAVGRRRTEVAADPKLLAWLRATAPCTRRVCSVCTSAFVLAASGLLDGRRCTSHWKYCEELQRQFPRIIVDPNLIFVRDGRFYSSAGASAGMDLALALVEEDLGHQMALTVARELVLFLQRPGGQSQFSAQLTAQRADRRPLSELQAWMADHPDEDLSVDALARRAAMSPRNFARVFADEVGVTPARYVELLRVDTARRRLEESGANVERVAEQCGFGSAETMRRVFLRVLQVSPSAYRGRFRARG